MLRLRVASEVSRGPSILQVVQAGTSTAACFPFVIARERHRNVPVPGSSNVNNVEVELVKILEIPLSLAEPCWFRLTGVRARHLLRVHHFFRHQIADRLDLHTFDCEQILQQLVPRPPTPMIPSRTRSLASNGTAIIPSSSHVSVFQLRRDLGL